jgi:hypothetical protein
VTYPGGPSRCSRTTAPCRFLGPDRDVQLAVGNRETKGDAPVEPSEELPRVLVRVGDDTSGGFGCLVQPGRFRHPHIDPCVDGPGQIADGDRGLVGIRYSTRERETVHTLEEVREQACDEVVLGFGRVTSEAQGKRLIYAPRSLSASSTSKL